MSPEQKASKAPKSTAIPKTSAATSSTTVSASVKNKIQKLSCTFENSTSEKQYNYIEDIGDGRGYTMGFVGFCSGTGDGLMFLKEYQTLEPNNPLVEFLPRFEEIDKAGGGMNADTSGLEKFPDAFKSCATDPKFVQAQENLADQLYWNPSQKMAEDISIKYNITKGELYDAYINHGEDGANKIIEDTNSAVGGTPKSGVDEKVWLAKFLDLREKTLSSDETWQSSVDRTKVYRKLLEDGNVDLSGDLNVSVYGQNFTIK